MLFLFTTLLIYKSANKTHTTVSIFKYVTFLKKILLSPSTIFNLYLHINVFYFRHLV